MGCGGLGCRTLEWLGVVTWGKESRMGGMCLPGMLYLGVGGCSDLG